MINNKVPFVTFPAFIWTCINKFGKNTSIQLTTIHSIQLTPSSYVEPQAKSMKLERPGNGDYADEVVASDDCGGYDDDAEGGVNNNSNNNNNNNNSDADVHTHTNAHTQTPKKTNNYSQYQPNGLWLTFATCWPTTFLRRCGRGGMEPPWVSKCSSSSMEAVLESPQT